MASVLIVDDDETSRVILDAAIREMGHVTEFASDGVAGLARYREHHFDLVIMDLAMPKKNGLMAIRELHEDYPGARIVAISGESADQLDLAEDYGATCTLVKPVSPREVQDLLAELLKDAAGSGGFDSDLYRL